MSPSRRSGILSSLLLGLATSLPLPTAAPTAAQIAVPPQPIAPFIPLQNGGFENPDLPPARHLYDPPNGGWTFSSGSGVAANGSGFGNPAAPEGDQVAFVQSTGSLDQSFALAPGRYRISFKAAQRDYLGVNAQQLELRLDGAVLATIKPAGASFASYTTQSFLLGAGTHQLRIAGLPPPSGDHTAFLDAVEIQSLAAIAKSWADPAAWQGGAVPTAATDGTIAAGAVVLLDQAAAKVRNLLVLGELICADQKLGLEAETVMVHGRLECGSEWSPYQQTFVLTLTGATTVGSPTGKSIEIMAPGALELHGAPRLAWTQLRANAVIGDTTLYLADPVDWQKGDTIVIAPSAYHGDPYAGTLIHEDETATILDVQNSGRDLQLTAPLGFPHYGSTSTYSTASGSFTLDERSEVGLLSRNIRIEGDLSSDSSFKGGHLMSMVGSQTHVSGVELFRMGRLGELARYPFHWHLVGDAPGQYLRNSSVHRSYNRCVTVHGTNQTRVEDNVCHDFVGHGYFLENGSERLNLFDHNLGIRARKPAEADAVPDPLLDKSDFRTSPASNGPAVFWISNADNTFTRNAAAGSEGAGFWYRQENEAVNAFGGFTDNRVHSSTQGLSTCRDGGGPPGLVPSGGPLLFENLTVYHTSQGIWPCSSDMNRETHRFRGLVVANTWNGMQAPDPMIVEQSAFIAYSANAPTVATSDLNRRAIQIYDQGFVLDRVAFVDYHQPATSVFFPGSGAHKLAKNRSSGISLVNSPNLFPDPEDASHPGAGPAEWGDVVHDLDGSLLGAPLALVNDHPLMYDAACEKPFETAAGGPLRVAGYACPYRYGHFRAEHAFSYLDPGYLPSISPITVLRSDGVHQSNVHTDRRFITEFELDDNYRYTWRYDQGARHNNVQIELRDADPGSEPIFEILDVPAAVTVKDAGGAPFSAATDLTDLESGPGHRFLWRDHSLFLKMSASGLPWHAMDVAQVCMTGAGCCTHYWDCPIPGDDLALGTLPKLDIVSPADGARFPSGATITVAAAAAPSSGPITAAYLYLGDAFVGADRTPPYTFTLPALADGAYALKLRASTVSGDKSFTTVQQILVGDSAPRVEITSLAATPSTWEGAQAVPVAFQLVNWPLTGGHHLRLLDNDLDAGLGKITGTGTLQLTGLAQGRHELELALGGPAGKLSAATSRRTVYVMHGGWLADFEDGLDLRTTLTGDANAHNFTPIGWAWGNSIANPGDGEDDINYFDVYNDGDPVDGTVTWRLALGPGGADWQTFKHLEIRSAGIAFEAVVVHAGGAATSLGLSTAQSSSNGWSTFTLPGNPALIDKVVALELRFAEANLPTKPANPIPRLHLFGIRLAP